MLRVVKLLSLFVLLAASPAHSQTPGSSRAVVPAQRSIAGEVVNEDGAPIFGAEILWTSGEHAMTLRSGPGGRFQAVSPESWKHTDVIGSLGSLWVFADDYAMSAKSILGGDEQLHPELELKVTLRRLPADSKPAIRVVDPKGQPVAGALVQPANERYQTLPAQIVDRFTGRTNPRGIVELPVPPGSLSVTTPDSGTQLFEWSPAPTAPSTRKFSMRPCGRLEGTIGGTPESRRGLKISLRTVLPQSADDDQEYARHGVRGPSVGVATVEFDEEGRFSIPALAAGNLSIEIESPPDAKDRPVFPIGVNVAADSTTPLVISMQPAVMVTGRVVDHVTGQPIPGLQMRVTSAAFVHVMATTDADGRFRTAALPGHVTAMVWSYMSPERGSYYPPLPVASKSITVQAGAPGGEIPEFRLTPARRIIGRIVDAKDAPVKGLVVTINRLQLPGYSNEEGYFAHSIPFDVEPQTFTVGHHFGHKGEATVISRSPLILRQPNFEELNGVIGVNGLLPPVK